jgi:hypothetical protein
MSFTLLCPILELSALLNGSVNEIIKKQKRQIKTQRNQGSFQHYIRRKIVEPSQFLRTLSRRSRISSLVLHTNTSKIMIHSHHSFHVGNDTQKNKEKLWNEILASQQLKGNANLEM